MAQLHRRSRRDRTHTQAKRITIKSRSFVGLLLAHIGDHMRLKTQSFVTPHIDGTVSVQESVAQFRHATERAVADRVEPQHTARGTASCSGAGEVALPTETAPTEKTSPRRDWTLRMNIMSCSRREGCHIEVFQQSVVLDGVTSATHLLTELRSNISIPVLQC